jgi:glycosyltransferase involved in cell wall biosynthesis
VRILHITEASWAGTLQVVRTLAADQAARGHEVTLAYADQPQAPADLAVTAATGVELAPIAWVRRSPASQLAAGRALRRLARERRPDLVHLHSSFAGAVGALALPRGVPLIYTPHGFAFARKGVGRATGIAVRAIEALVARRCTVLGAVSEAEGELARSGLRAPRVAVVRNGIPELDHGVPERSDDRSAPAVVALGRIAEQRRPAATARILAALATDARVGWIGGSGDGDDGAVRDAGIPVTGWLPHSEALDRLAEATVYLHWSAWDGQSLAILEAIARDVVVVASDIPANREIVGPRQVCTDERSAIELVRSVLADPALRAGLLAAQRRRAPDFSARRMSAEWLAVYEQTLRPASGVHVQSATTALAARKIGEPWT